MVALAGLISKRVDTLDCNCTYERREPFHGSKLFRADSCRCYVRVNAGKRRGLVPDPSGRGYKIGTIFVGSGSKKARIGVP